MTQGVIYWNSGTKLLTRLMVSLGSLRDVYSGPVTVILNNDVPKEYASNLEKNGFAVKWVEMPSGGKEALIGKTRLYESTPYDITVFIDGDTLILRPFDELFKWAEEYGFVVTAFSDWNVKEGAIAKRVRSWHDQKLISDEEFKAASEYPAGINVGVLAFKKDASIWKDWSPLSRKGIDAYIPDEIGCQILLPKHKHYLAPQYFNSSCRYSAINDDTRIIHYHGRKHCRLEKTRRVDKIGTARLWIAKYKQLMSKNWANIVEISQKWPDRHMQDLDKIDENGNPITTPQSAQPSAAPTHALSLPPTFVLSKLAPSMIELEWLHKFLKDSDEEYNSVLEFGAGITTWVINDAAEPNYYLALEDFPLCVEQVKRHCPTVELATKWDAFKDKEFDLVFVDSSIGAGKEGLQRHLCAEAAIPHLKKNGIIIVHDWHGRSGKSVRAYLEDRNWSLVASVQGKTGIGVYERGTPIIAKNQVVQQAYVAPKVQPEADVDDREAEPDADEPAQTQEEFNKDYSKITVVTAGDEAHLDKLLHTIPNWIRLKGFNCPIIVFLNGTSPSDTRLSPLSEFPNVKIIPWDWPNAETQREKMLSSFVFGVAEHVTTPFHLKLDCVDIAMNDMAFLSPGFYEYDLVAPGWGYTKPGSMVPRLDYWMEGLSKIGAITGFKGADPVNSYGINNNKYIAKRIASWIKLMRTSTVQDIVKCLPLKRMPVPSEDTTCWRWCERLNLKWRGFNFKHRGWFHSKKEYVKLTEEAYATHNKTAVQPTT